MLTSVGENRSYLLNHRVTTSYYCCFVTIDAIHTAENLFSHVYKRGNKRKRKQQDSEENKFKNFPSQGQTYNEKTTKVTCSIYVNE